MVTMLARHDVARKIKAMFLIKWARSTKQMIPSSKIDILKGYIPHYPLTPLARFSLPSIPLWPPDLLYYLSILSSKNQIHSVRAQH